MITLPFLQRPLFVLSLDKEEFPQVIHYNMFNFIVYALWEADNLLKYVYTWKPVLEKMLGGAGLFCTNRQ